MNADGTDATLLVDDPSETAGFTWSPDGSRIVFVSTREGNTDLYMVNIDGTGLIRLTDHPAVDGSPSWEGGIGLN